MMNSHDGPAAHSGNDGHNDQNFQLSECSQNLTRLRHALNNQLQNSIANPLLLKRGQRPDHKNLIRVPVSSGFNQEIRDTIVSRVVGIIDTALSGPDTLREFNFANASSDRILALHLDDFAKLANWFDSIPPVSNLDIYNGEESFQKYVNGVVTNISIPDTDKDLIAFGKWSSTLLLEKQGFIGQFSFGPNNYEPVSRSNIIRLNDDIDFFLYDRYVYIKDDSAFESMLSFREMTREMANEAFQHIIQALPVRDSSKVFESLRSSARRLKRVAKTRGASHVQLLSINAVDQLIRQRELPIYVDNGEVVIDPQDANQIDALIYIINDAYARSVLTELMYRIHDADQLQ